MMPVQELTKACQKRNSMPKGGLNNFLYKLEFFLNTSKEMFTLGYDIVRMIVKRYTAKATKLDNFRACWID